MMPGGWELASLACKLLLYLGAAVALGGALCLLRGGDRGPAARRALLRYALAGPLLGVPAAAGAFLAQVGQVAGRGPAGAFDPAMMRLLLDTPAGDLALFRLLGFAAMLAGALAALRRRDGTGNRALMGGTTAGMLLLLYGFRFGGHMSTLSPAAQLAHAFHFAAFAAWIGALPPLLRLTRTETPAALRSVMTRFGRDAVWVVPPMLAAGAFMATRLLHAPAELTGTAYGRALLLKLALAAVALGLAALNRLALTPGLERPGSPARLRLSIRIEMLAALALLLATAWLSTLIGPPHHP